MRKPNFVWYLIAKYSISHLPLEGLVWSVTFIFFACLLKIRVEEIVCIVVHCKIQYIWHLLLEWLVDDCILRNGSGTRVYFHVIIVLFVVACVEPFVDRLQTIEYNLLEMDLLWDFSFFTLSLQRVSLCCLAVWCGACRVLVMSGTPPTHCLTGSILPRVGAFFLSSFGRLSFCCLLGGGRGSCRVM